MDQKNMGGFIADRRRTLGFTQQTLADRLGVTDKAVSKWERGLSYPDITLLTPLAEALGVTERALLNGESTSEEEAELPAPSDLLALSYLGTATRERRKRISQVLMAAYAVSLILGVFTSLVVDLAINHTITWSLIVLASCVLGLGVVYPLYRAPRNKLFFSCLSLTVLLIPFLVVVEYASPVRGWMPHPALNMAALSLAYLWVPVLLHRFTKMNLWYIFALVCLLSSPFSITINRLAGSPSEGFELIINILAALLLSGTLVVLGLLLRRKRVA